MVLKMSNDRSLVVTKAGNTYQNENSAEFLKILLPRNINGVDLNNCYVYLNYINQSGLGDICDISPYIREYSDERYVVEVPMYQMFTYEPGIVEMWIKVLYPPTEMVAKTNSISHLIIKHKDAEGALPEQKMSVVDELVVKMDATEAIVGELDNKVDEIDDKVEGFDERIDNVADKADEVDDKVDRLAEKVDNIISGDEQITQDVLIGKVHNEEEE